MTVSDIIREITKLLADYDRLRTLVLVGSLQDISEQDFESRKSWDMDLVMIVNEVRPDVTEFVTNGLRSLTEALSSESLAVTFSIEEGPIFRKTGARRALHIQLMLHDSSSIMRESPLIITGWLLGKHLAGQHNLRTYSLHKTSQPKRTLLMAPLGLYDSLKMVEQGQVRRYHWKTVQGRSVRMRTEEHLEGVHLALLYCYCALNSLRNFARCLLDREIALDYGSDAWLSQLKEAVDASVLDDAKYVWNQRARLIAGIERSGSHGERQELRKRCQRIIENLASSVQADLRDEGPAVVMDGAHFSLLWVADLSLLMSEDEQHSFRYDWLAGKHSFESLEGAIGSLSVFERVDFSLNSYPQDTFLGAFLRPGHSCDWFQRYLVFRLPDPQRIEAGSLIRAVSGVSIVLDERLSVCLRIDVALGEGFDLDRILVTLPELERLQKSIVGAVFGADSSCSFVTSWNRAVSSHSQTKRAFTLSDASTNLRRFKDSAKSYSICVMDIREISQDWRSIISSEQQSVRKLELSAHAVEFGREMTALFSENPYHKTRSSYSMSYVASVLRQSRTSTNDEVLLINDRSLLYLPPPYQDRSEEENNRRIQAIDSKLPAIASVVLMASVWKYIAMNTTDRLHREVALLFEKSVRSRNYSVRSSPIKRLVGQLYAVATGLRHLEQILSFEERTSSRMSQSILKHLKKELQVDESAFQKEAAQIEALANICHQGILQIQNNRFTLIIILMTIVMLFLAIVEILA